MRSDLRHTLSACALAFALALQAPAPCAPAGPATGEGVRGTTRAAALDSLLSAPALDLALLERAVLERNPSLGAMRAAWRGAQAAADQAGALDDPMVEASSAPKSWGGRGGDAGYMLGISQRVPIFGQRGLRGRASRAGARALGEDYRTARLDLIRETRRGYYEHYLAARGLAVTAELKDLLDQFRKIALAKYSAGTVGLDDALQAEVELAMLDHQEVALRRDRRVLSARLNTLLQREAVGPLPDPPPDLPVAAHPAGGDSLLLAAIGQRPELKSWAAQSEARAEELSLARRERLPELTLMGRYDRYESEPDMRPQVGASMNLPILFGRAGAGVRRARAGLDEAEYRRRAAQAEIAFEVESAFAAAEETGHEVHIMEERVVPATERALQAIRAGYESNRTDFLTLLNAERDLARARLDLYRARVAHLQALADLDRAVGAGAIEPAPEVTR